MGRISFFFARASCCVRSRPESKMGSLIIHFDYSESLSILIVEIAFCCVNGGAEIKGGEGQLHH